MFTERRGLQINPFFSLDSVQPYPPRSTPSPWDLVSQGTGDGSPLLLPRALRSLRS